MNYYHMTAPCGLDCFNCRFYLAIEDAQAMEKLKQLSEEHNVPAGTMLCRGCRNHNGRIPLQKHIFGETHRCAAYECSQNKDMHFCGDCGQFPCDELHPYADRAGELPHNI